MFRIRVQPSRIRTTALLILLGISSYSRLRSNFEPVRAFQVRPIMQWEWKFAKNQLLGWDIKQHIRRATSLPREPTFVSDPRSALNLLWDELSYSERRRTLIALGFPPDTTAYQLVHGPQPRVFTESGVYWCPADLLPIDE